MERTVTVGELKQALMQIADDIEVEISCLKLPRNSGGKSFFIEAGREVWY